MLPNNTGFAFLTDNAKKHNRISTYMKKNSKISSNHVKLILMVLTTKLSVISLFVLSRLLLLKIGYFLDNVYITISL